MHFRVLKFCRSMRAGAVGRRGIAISVSIVVMSGCSGPSATPVSSAATTVEPAVVDEMVIVYNFFDSSVPPPSHRSLELTVSRTQSRLVIDSYGDVLADESRPTPPEVWSGLVDGVPSLAALGVEGAQDGCVGGTGEAVHVSIAKQVILKLAVDACAGSNERVSDAIGSWIKPARDLFPSTEDLAPTG